jgi:tetratricopeptide (TPR) repeat protein
MAWQLRDRTSERERFYLTATYEGLAAGNLERARQNDEAWARTYPRDPVPHSMLSGYPNKATGRYQQAIAEAEKAVEADPDFAIAYYNLGVNNLYLGRIPVRSQIPRASSGVSRAPAMRPIRRSVSRQPPSTRPRRPERSTSTSTASSPAPRSLRGSGSPLRSRTPRPAPGGHSL